MIDEVVEQTLVVEEKTKNSAVKKLLVFFAITLLGFLLIGSCLIYLNLPPTYTGVQTVSIVEGDSVPKITEKLEDAGVVKSSELLYFVLISSFDPTKIKASRYVFEEPLTVYQVAERLISGDFDTDLVSLTIYEGESRKKMAKRLGSDFSWFEAEKFLLLTEGHEGQLFPDTYFVPADYSTEKLITLLNKSYAGVMRDYQSAIEASSFSEANIIVLASIVEREANSYESMRLVAGIFLNRLEIGMALQADASIEYVIEEGLNDLPPGALAESLREIDSPYNTYLYPGLPPTPIGNPGRAAIEAVLFPTMSKYLYYITGNDGEFYYAENYNEHLRNINNYLR